MQVLDNRWVKPFASGMACIDTITTECERGKTVQECMDICSNSTKCDYGYHVRLPNEDKSYCLPLNGMPQWGNPTAFVNSTIKPENSPILSQTLGVQVTAFQNPDVTKLDVEDDTDVSQLDVYFLRYRLNPARPESDLYLLKDMVSFGDDPNDALKIMIIRDLPVSSGISTTERVVRNGMLVFVKNVDNNNVFLFFNPTSFGFFPFTMRWSSSIAFNVQNLYHTQIIKEYPFYHDPIKIEDAIAIRSANAPVGDAVFYWDMDIATRRLVMRKVRREDMADYAHLEQYKVFSLERVDRINIFDAENFVNSQSNYLFSAFPTTTPSSSTARRVGWRWILVVVVAILSIVAMLYVRRRRRLYSW